MPKQARISACFIIGLPVVFTHFRYKHWFILLHRYLGLTSALFLLVAGLTGSLLAYHDEIDQWLNPQLFYTAQQGDQFLEPSTLFLAARRYASSIGARFATMPLNTQPGRSLTLWINHQGQFKQLFINPYNADIIGLRDPDNLSDSWRNLMGFVLKLHYTLWMPGNWGFWLLGMIALLWTLNCFVALAVSFPVLKVFDIKLLLKRWQQNLSMRWHSRGFAFHFLLHRAAGLWLWGLLLIFAWSSVAFNLRDVYQPVTYTMLGEPPATPAAGHQLAEMKMYKALMFARQHARDLSEEYQLELGIEGSIRYSEFSNSYIYRFNSSRDLDPQLTRSRLTLDASSGELLGVFWPSEQHAATTTTQWLYALHMAEVFGWPYQLLVCLLGLMVAYFSYSGVLIWWKKQSKKGGLKRNNKKANTHPIKQ